MTTSTITRTLLTADEGKILTNGSVYGTDILLADGESTEDYHEITIDEYNSTQSQEAVPEE